MKKSLLASLVIVLLAVLPASAATLASIASDIGATVDPGLAPAGLPGTVVAYDGTGYQTSPYSLPDYDYAIGSGMGSAAGQARDFHWVHESSGAFASPDYGTMWDFGNLAGTEFILDPSIDHDPVPEEGIETTLYGRDASGAWIQARVVKFYAQGWDANSIDDGASSLYQFASPVSLISAVAGFYQAGSTDTYFLNYSDDTEIDTISMVPEPMSGLMLLGGLPLLVRRRRSA